MNGKCISLAALILVFTSCSVTGTEPEGPSYGCTAEFVVYALTVLGPNATLADSVQVTVTKQANEEIFPCGEYLCEEGQAGRYVIMHDGLREQISNTGETVIVEGTKGKLQFSEEFVFRGGICHVEKIAGPDTVSLSQN